MAKTKGTINLKRKSQENADDAKPSKHSKVKPTADEPSTSSGNNADNLVNVEPKSNLLSLNDDVIFEIFNFLSLNDLCAISQQCLRLYELAENHFNRRYPREAGILNMLVEQDGILKYPDCSKHSLIFSNLPRISIDYTPGTTKKSTVYSFDDIFELNSIFKNNPKENRIKELRFEKWLKLMPAHGQGLKDVVGKAKSVIFSNTIILDEFYETILKYASSMELLTVWQSFEI